MWKQLPEKESAASGTSWNWKWDRAGGYLGGRNAASREVKCQAGWHTEGQEYGKWGDLQNASSRTEELHHLISKWL